MAHLKAKICDSIPGSGKTEAAIAMMRASPNKKYLFVTPYLDEVSRIKNSCPELNFEEPESRGRYVTKSDALIELLKEGRNIAHSHALFAYYGNDVRHLIAEQGYTLVLDEVYGVVTQEPISVADVKLLFDRGFLKLDDDGYHVRWIGDECLSRLQDIKRKADMRNLFLSANKLLYWSVPFGSFECFQEIYILTYLFRAQMQRYYCEYYGMEFEYIGVRKTESGGYEFAEYGLIPDYARDLINKVHILDDQKYNSVVRENTYGSELSSSWFSKQKAKKKTDTAPAGGEIPKLASAVRAVLNRIYNAKSSETIWTTYKENRKDLEFSRYKSCFLSWNARATNSYSHCRYMAYCLNVYMHANEKLFLLQFGAKPDEDLYALSEMIQWVWRSAIRRGEEVWIYIPSVRMRNLLQEWLESLAAGVDFESYHASLKPSKKKERVSRRELQNAANPKPIETRYNRRKRQTKENAGTAPFAPEQAG